MLTRREILLLVLAVWLFSSCVDIRPSVADRGDPRLLNDGSESIPSKSCPPGELRLGWDVRFYNVGGSGRVHLTLIVNGATEHELTTWVAADHEHNATLVTSPTRGGVSEIQVNWSLLDKPGSEKILVGPTSVSHPCWV